jgi:hypothetical protein
MLAFLSLLGIKPSVGPCSSLGYMLPGMESGVTPSPRGREAAFGKRGGALASEKAASHGHPTQHLLLHRDGGRLHAGTGCTA